MEKQASLLDRNGERYHVDQRKWRTKKDNNNAYTLDQGGKSMHTIMPCSGRYSLIRTWLGAAGKSPQSSYILCVTLVSQEGTEEQNTKNGQFRVGEESRHNVRSHYWRKGQARLLLIQLFLGKILWQRSYIFSLKPTPCLRVSLCLCVCV